MSKVYFFTHDLKPLCEVTCRSQWSAPLNTPDGQLGTASLYLSVNETKLDRGITRFGNVVVIVPGFGLPLWCGEVGEPQNADQGEIEIGATSIEIVLDDRNVIGRIEKGSAGTQLNDILAESALAAPMILNAGDIDDGGSVVRTLGGQRSALSYLQDLQRKYGGEWGVDCVLGPGNVPSLSVFYRPRIGVDLSGSVALIEGTNIKFADSPIVERFGRVKNDVTVINHGGKDDRVITGRAINQRSVDLYGLRQLILAENLRSQANADARAAHEAEARGFPQRRFNVTANNPAVYPSLRMGNTLRLQLLTIRDEDGGVGIDTRVRVIGLAWDDQQGEVPLVLEEVFD